jgi:heme-degrading monooxygenase HmoA
MFRSRVVAAQEGLVGCDVGRPIGRNDDEFTMVSIWRDLDALSAFTGEDWERPVIPDKREAALIVESFAHHYDGYRSMPAQPLR